MEPKYKRVLLKLSGEALAGDGHVGIDYDNTVLSICRSIKECVDLGVEVAIVVGGGNFWRGRSSGKHGPYPGRSHGYAGYCDQCPRPLPTRWSQHGRGCTGSDCHRHDFGCRALYPQPCGTASGKGQGSNLRLRHGQVPSSPPIQHLRCVRLRSMPILSLRPLMVDGVYDKDPHKYDDAVRYEELILQ